MFENELELERKSSNVVPLLMALGLVLLIGGVVFYVVRESRQKLTPEQARTLVSTVLKNQAPAAIRFHVGVVKPSVNDRPGDPHYKLLEKAGILKIVRHKDGSATVAITPDGERVIQQISGVARTKEKDGTELYSVPMAQRELADLSEVAMNGPSAARIEYSWKWNPNRLGDVFDASGSAVKSFNTWERSTLIQKYGVDFYHADPKRSSLRMVRQDKDWRVAAE